MEAFRFSVDGGLFGLELEQAKAIADKLRTAGETTLADAIYRGIAEDRDEAIILSRDDGSAAAMYDVLLETYSDDWGSQQVTALRDALGVYLGR